MAKDDQVSFGSTNYKALSEEKVTSIMRQKLIDYKMVVFPVEQETSRTGSITHVDVKYKMVNVEAPEESIIIASCGDGADTQDKGSGKAMTYAFKYMWLRTFALPTGEDPDKISSAELDAKATTRPQPCSRCGADLYPVKKRDGTEWSTDDMAVYATRRYGAVLCAACMKAVDKEERNADKQGKVAERQ